MSDSTAVRSDRDQRGASTVRILVVDDHPVVRQGYRQLLSNQPDFEVCGEADSPTDAARLARETDAHLAIVDITLNDGSGLELIKRLKQQGEKIKILAASAHEESLFAERCLRAGALGYINKKAALEHLVDAVRTVMDGEIYLSQSMKSRLLHQLSGGKELADTSPVVRLTNRELQAFELMGHGLTTRDIAERMHISPKTVDRYREQIKEKLDLGSVNEIVHHATQWVLEQQ